VRFNSFIVCIINTNKVKPRQLDNFRLVKKPLPYLHQTIIAIHRYGYNRKKNGHRTMSVSSTTAAVYISRQNFCNGACKNGNVFLTSVSFASKQRRFYIRSSSDGAAETAATEVEDSENYIEVPGGPPSLISALNVERALRGIRKYYNPIYIYIYIYALLI